ncbi:hypothetical protein AAHE18_03G127400 [Arachis hypogaea]
MIDQSCHALDINQYKDSRLHRLYKQFLNFLCTQIKITSSHNTSNTIQENIITTLKVDDLIIFLCLLSIQIYNYTIRTSFNMLNASVSSIYILYSPFKLLAVSYILLLIHQVKGWHRRI